MLNRLVRKEVKSLPENFWYSEKPKARINLQSCENTIKPKKVVINAVIRSLNKLNKYPDGLKTDLIRAIAEYNGVNTENIIVGNGSDELIELVAKTFLNKGENVIIPLPTFPTYVNAATLMGAIVRTVKLNDDFSLNIEKIIEKIDNKTKIIFIANPNNPTGNILVLENDVKRILDNFSGIVVIDECYFEFSNYTVSNLLKRYKKLIILRSFSKTFSLAGLRIGYAIANDECIAWMNRVSNTIQPFNVNECGQNAARIALKNNTINKFLKAKNNFFRKLINIDNIEVLPTKTTFLLVKILNTKLSSTKVKQLLEEKSILIKDCNIFNLGNNYIRIGIPEERDMNYVIESVKEIFE